MSGTLALSTPFVVDAETLQHFLFDEATHPLAKVLSDAISSKDLLITFASMVQLRENCPEIHAMLLNADVKAIRRGELIDLSSAMLEEVQETGIAVNNPLQTKIFLLALARNKGCCVVTVDCRPTENSTSKLGAIFGVQIICVGGVFGAPVRSAKQTAAS